MKRCGHGGGDECVGKKMPIHEQTVYDFSRTETAVHYPEMGRKQRWFCGPKREGQLLADERYIETPFA